MGRGCFI
ncbi:hypothetical protein F383_16548 [Gossypium arboreum]|nr:hypothetical protein F383_16548 [Gossypium arboreum]